MIISSVIWKCSNRAESWGFGALGAVTSWWAYISSDSIRWPWNLSSTGTKPTWITLCCHYILSFPFTVMASCAGSRFMGTARAEKSFLAFPSGRVCRAQTVTRCEIVIILWLVCPSSIDAEITWRTWSTRFCEPRAIAELSSRTSSTVCYTRTFLKAIVIAFTAWILCRILSSVWTVMTFGAGVRLIGGRILRAEVPFWAPKASSLSFIGVICSSSTAQWECCTQFTEVALRTWSSNGRHNGRPCCIWATPAEKAWCTLSCFM